MYWVQGETKVVNSRFCDVVIALGSNQGDRRAHLAYAISALETLFTEVRASPFVETVAEGVGGQPGFLNGVVVGLTALLPQDLMKALLEIEKERGRLRPYPGAPRTLDLDLILLGSCMFENKHLLFHDCHNQQEGLNEKFAATDTREAVLDRGFVSGGLYLNH